MIFRRFSPLFATLFELLPPPRYRYICRWLLYFAMLLPRRRHAVALITLLLRRIADDALRYLITPCCFRCFAMRITLRHCFTTLDTPRDI